MKVTEIFEGDKVEPTLTKGEKALGWIIKNGVKMKIGKGREITLSRVNDHEGERVGGKRNKQRYSDDGSHGLSAAERNR